MAFAQYYDLCGKTDSAIVYCNLVLEKGTDIYNQYDASRLLHRIYSKRGDVQNSNRYAAVYMALSDSLDFGKRQELASTVNNQFQYHLGPKERTKPKRREREVQEHAHHCSVGGNTAGKYRLYALCQKAQQASEGNA